MAENRPAAHGPKTSLDIGTPIGVFVGFATMIVAFILEGGQPLALVSYTSVMIVFGGTAFALLSAFPMPIFLKFPQYLRKAFFEEHEDPLEAVQTFTRLADKARREGLLSLDEEAQHLEDDFLREGIQEVVDGTPPETIVDMLQTRISQMEARHKVGKDLFEQGAGFAPTMGIIGTVMALVVTLAGLATSGTEQLGHSISTAFIATLYGVMSANLFWGNIGKRLHTKSELEIEHLHMKIAGILAIQAGDSPRLVQTRLAAYLEPADRARLAQGGQAGAPATAAAGA